MGFLSWLSDLFESPEEYGVPSVTLTGQQVRSRGEKIIADYLTYHGIIYYYETQAMSNDWIFSHKISKPDFYLPRYNLFIEYWGLVDSPDTRTRNDYIRTMKWKMKQYHLNNIRFVSIYPSYMRNLDYFFRREFRKVEGFDLPAPPTTPLCSICHQQIRDWPLHVDWHARMSGIPRP